VTPERPVYVRTPLLGEVALGFTPEVLAVAVAALEETEQRHGASIVGYEIDPAWVRLLVEADDARGLSKLMQGLGICMARRVNKPLGRKGRVFADRYDVDVLERSTDVDAALAEMKKAAARFARDRIARVGWLNQPTTRVLKAAAPSGRRK
jgi:hypothetical protein